MIGSHSRPHELARPPLSPSRQFLAIPSVTQESLDSVTDALGMTGVYDVDRVSGIPKEFLITDHHGPPDRQHEPEGGTRGLSRLLVGKHDHIGASQQRSRHLVRQIVGYEHYVCLEASHTDLLAQASFVVARYLRGICRAESDKQDVRIRRAEQIHGT